MVGEDILVFASVASEIDGVLDRIGRSYNQVVGGRLVRCGQINHISLRSVITGPGIINTVQAVTSCVENARPSLMIQIGCGGGFRQLGMHVGDIAVATAEVDVHLGIENGKKNSPLLEIPFSMLELHNRVFKEKYPLNLHVAETAFLILKTIFSPNGIGVFKGPFITGSTITGSEERADFLFKSYSPCIESMEGAGAAFLSHYYRLPFLEIRCVSNMVGKRDLSQWDLALACRRAGDAAANLIEFFSKEQT